MHIASHMNMDNSEWHSALLMAVFLRDVLPEPKKSSFAHFVIKPYCLVLLVLNVPFSPTRFHSIFKLPVLHQEACYVCL